MQYEYKPRGTCAQAITFDVEDGKVYNVKFTGGCPGNTVGVAVLINGMDIDDAIARMKGIRCGPKSTSCPDQLAKALEQAKNTD